MWCICVLYEMCAPIVNKYNTRRPPNRNKQTTKQISHTVAHRIIMGFFMLEASIYTYICMYMLSCYSHNMPNAAECCEACARVTLTCARARVSMKYYYITAMHYRQCSEGRATVATRRWVSCEFFAEPAQSTTQMFCGATQTTRERESEHLRNCAPVRRDFARILLLHYIVFWRSRGAKSEKRRGWENNTARNSKFF